MREATTKTQLIPDRFYRPVDEELRVIGAVQTLARWRHEGRGPAYHLSGARVLYRGSDLIEWLNRHRISTEDSA